MLSSNISPSLSRIQHTKLATRKIVHMQEDLILHFQREGVISYKDAKKLCEKYKGKRTTLADFIQQDNYE